MIRKTVCAVLLAVAWLWCSSISAQEKSPRDRLAAAHAMYYTPTAGGLKSFRCDATMDWPALLTRFGGREISADNPYLKYLQTVHLSVTDDLRGRGSLEWSSTVALPEGKEAAVKQMQAGFQQMMAGFFQAWNAYMNGSMVPLPDSTVSVTKSGEGVHLSGISKDTKFDEDFDRNMLLTQVLEITPDLRVLAKPTYSNTADGLLLSAVTSQMNEPPSAPQSETTFRIEYERVDSFQIPTHVILDVKNTGLFEFGLSACQVSVDDWAKKPQPR